MSSNANNRARRYRRALFLALCCLAACQPYLFDPADRARERIRAAGWTETKFDNAALPLIGFHSTPTGRSGVLHVYIEGDGRAWASRARPSDDPTPLAPVALDLALQDPAGTVLYLSRPCQYVRDRVRTGCDARLWTSHRFSDPVIDATNAAISAFARRTGAEEIVLFGYSGGGALAALIAARRDDIFALVTVAGTLDHRSWTEHHGVSPLTGSRNPHDIAVRLGALRQIHFVGADDDVMPELVARSFLAALPPNHRARLIVIKDFDHGCCWAKSWPRLLDRSVTAGR